MVSLVKQKRRVRRSKNLKDGCLILLHPRHLHHHLHPLMRYWSVKRNGMESCEFCDSGGIRPVENINNWNDCGSQLQDSPCAPGHHEEGRELDTQTLVEIWHNN